MLCPPLEIPDRLQAALEKGELVIFAGAGISMGPPADLPSFWSLANSIALHLGATPLTDKTPPDLFLSRLKRDKHNVHEAAGTLIRAAVDHNEYHELVLRLFRDPAKIRIVTSNFDSLFSRAATKLGIPLSTYSAPALPLAEDFVGVVHLHGSSSDTSANRLVLTADDFGQAYLTRGWARRFLLDLYDRYTVLFLGYSHADVPLQYLAYGLRGTGTQPRFVLDHEPPEKWLDLGVTLIPYVREPDPAPDRYVNLKVGLRAWAAEIERNPLESEVRLDQVLNSSTAPSAADEDFLLRALKRPAAARHFVEYAKSTRMRWIEWLEGKGELRPYLHLDAAQADEPSHVIAHWIGRHLAHSVDTSGLSIIERYKEQIGDIVWNGMALELARSKPDLLQAEEGPRWVAFLLSHVPARRNWYLLNRLLVEAAKRKLWATVMRVFDALTVPTVKLVESLPMPPDHSAVELSIALDGDVQNLLLSWEEAITPSLRELASSLAPILETKINHCQELAIMDGSADRFGNRILYTRQNIEFDAHPAFARGVHVLLNFFAAVLGALEADRAGAMDDWADRLLRSSNPILLRFGLWVLGRCRSLSAAAKLSWLIDRSLFYPPAYGGMRELSEMLKWIYPELDPKERERLWQSLEAAHPPPEDTSPEANLRREDVDRACWHLAQLNLNDPAAASAWRRLEVRNPRMSDRKPWLPGEHSRTISGGGGERSPRSVAEFLASAPSDQLELILTYQGEHWPNPSREGLLGVVAAAAREDKVWGSRLLHALVERRAWQDDVWYQLFWALRYPDLPAADQEWFLREAAPELAIHLRQVDALARFLYHGQTVEELRTVDPSEMRRCLEFSVVLWSATREKVKLEERDAAHADWQTTAINRAPGWIAEFWLMHQQLVAEATKEGEPAWPEEIRSSVDQAASGETDADLLALAVFASRIAFIRTSAPAWTRTRLYACLNFEAFSGKAWPPWSGLLLYASWSRDVALELKEPLRSAFGTLAKAPKDLTDRFVFHIAAIAAHSVFDVQADGWLKDFFSVISPAQRASWTSDLAREISRLTPDDRSQLWNDWVRGYWSDRVTRKAPPIEPDESESLVDLAAAFKENFSEAVAFLISGPPPNLEHFLPREFAGSDLPTAHPEAFLQALNWLLMGMHGLFLFPDELKGLPERLPKRRALLPLWDIFCQRLSDMNVLEARDLHAAGQAWFIE